MRLLAKAIGMNLTCRYPGSVRPNCTAVHNRRGPLVALLLAWIPGVASAQGLAASGSDILTVVMLAFVGLVLVARRDGGRAPGRERPGREREDQEPQDLLPERSEGSRTKPTRAETRQ